ncbi:Alpha/Beta hydrolase protein [Schizophyllum amplum]|uniref:Carboxylic ester hydrolase n=1 Tax=Schizophyllum amplum TaxID=97359 RepID=A0A550CEV1_9AGAR|nr:Alpha/Beta hydrolase protein [Auriculariopsis ampla]
MRIAHLRLLLLSLLCVPLAVASISDAELGLNPSPPDVGVNASEHAMVQDILGPVVDVGYAKYEGVTDVGTGTTRFLGMRYAVPPTGSQRWRAPEAPLLDSSAPLRKADHYPPMCACGDMGFAPLPRPQQPFSVQSEDCLFLNVFMPGDLKEEPAGKKPVIVWIHGGGYQTGSSSGYPGGGPYNGDDLVAAANSQAVVVTIQYRLGIFGFLAGTGVKDDGALNAGLLDQQRALRWVQEHIAKFGGDASDVTIWGQSAGGGSVLHHIIANGGNTNPPLFKKAMLSSLFVPPEYSFDDEIPETIYSVILAQAGCESLDCLREVDFETLRAINYNITTGAFFGTFIMAPVVDGTLVRRAPLQAVERGELNINEILTMTNSDEGGEFVTSETAALFLENYISKLFPTLSAEDARTGAALYEGMGSSTRMQTLVMSEAIFVCPTYNLGHGFDRMYKGTLAIPPGAHGQDINMFFRSLRGIKPFVWDPPSAEFAGAFSDYFMSYVLGGKPRRRFLDAAGWSKLVKTTADSVIGSMNKVTGLSLPTPQWLETTSVSTWAIKNPEEVLFNVTESGVPYTAQVGTDAALMKRCSFWWSMRGSTHQ